MVKEYMMEDKAGIDHYQPMRFSELYESTEADGNGYYLFHTFSYQNDTIPDTLSVYVKYNTFYEIERVIETDQTYSVLKK